MERLLQDERIRNLLREADDATRLLDRLGDGAPAHEIREALHGIYRDLGRSVHETWRKMNAAPVPPAETISATSSDPLASDDDFEFRVRDATSQEKTAESLEIDPSTDIPDVTSEPGPNEDLERWYTDEVEIGQQQPLFSPGELEEAHDTEIADLPPKDAADDDHTDIVSVDGFEVPPYPAGEAWVTAVRELVAMIGAPPGESSDLAEEVSRVQWAASAIDSRWAGFPPPVRTALIGVLASRARLLQERLEVDLGPRLALDRLRKHRRAAGLPTVAALQPDRGPDTGAWTEDARWWWRALTAGLEGPVN